MRRLIPGTLALAALVTAGHLAYGQGDGADNQIHPFAFLESLTMVIMPDGRAMHRQITDPSMTAMIMKNAKPMTTGMILFMHDGKIYTARDERASNGKMLSAMIMQPPQK